MACASEIIFLATESSAHIPFPLLLFSTLSLAVGNPHRICLPFLSSCIPQLQSNLGVIHHQALHLVINTCQGGNNNHKTGWGESCLPLQGQRARSILVQGNCQFDPKRGEAPPLLLRVEVVWAKMMEKKTISRPTSPLLR